MQNDGREWSETGTSSRLPAQTIAGQCGVERVIAGALDGARRNRVRSSPAMSYAMPMTLIGLATLPKMTFGAVVERATMNDHPLEVVERYRRRREESGGESPKPQ